MRKGWSHSTLVCSAVFAAQLSVSTVSAATTQNDDSVTQWGSWATLATAAGGNNPVLNLSFQFTDPQNFVDSNTFVTPTPENPESGPLFFGALSDTSVSSIQGIDDQDLLDLIFAGNSYGQNDRLMTNFDSTINLSSASPAFDVLGTGTFSTTDEYGNSLTSTPAIFIEGASPLGTLLAASSEGNDAALTINNTALFESKINGLNVGFIQLMNGETISKGTFVGGTPTAGNINTIQSLAGSTIATYNGTFLRSPFRGSVFIEVNFSNASWTGNFSNGQGVNFNVNNGLINGSSLTASTANITAAESSVNSGVVAANFFGDSAEAVAGIADVDIQGQDRFVDTFVSTTTGSSPR